jgi:radical SAM protein with 4Fe4S-binding SPASM domain
VIAAFPGRPLTWRAGWSFKLRGDGLPDGDHVIKAVAIDRDGSKAVIGIRTIRKARRAEGSIPPLRCHKPFDSLYIDARGNVYPYPDCHTDQPFGEHKGQPFEAIWSHARLIELREQMVAGCAPEMCRRCPLFINQEVDVPETFAAHGDFSTEDRR